MAVTGSVSSISSRSSFSIAMVSAVHAALTLGRWDSLGAAPAALLPHGRPARHGAVYLAYVVDGGVKRHGVDRGITLGDAENGRLSIFSSIYTRGLCVQ